jgi:putative tricarboxylic transport membrane protein
VDSAPKTKTRLDAVSAVFWFALALVICYRSTLLGVGSANEPGSGFIFFWSGVIMALLALIILAGSLRDSGDEARALIDIRWRKVSLVLAALVLYALGLEKFGFVLTTFALLSFLLWIGNEARWPIFFAVAGAAALGSFVLFDFWLKIRLPKGIFGF